MRSFFINNIENFKDGAIITDVVGIKGKIINEINPIIEKSGKNIDFIFGHPMAGREKRGIDFADRKVFKNANYIIVKDEKNKKENLELLIYIIKKMGFKSISFLTEKEHDEIIAFTSQLTHAIAVALVNSDSQKYDTNKFIGDSYRDLTRIAKINEDLWSELFIGNKENLLNMIEQFENELDIIKDSLKNEDLITLKEKFIISTKRREQIEWFYILILCNFWNTFLRKLYIMKEGFYMEKKYIKKLLGDKVYLSPISLDDVEEYTQMINNNIVSVGLGSIVYAGVYDVEKELESLKKIKNEYTFSIRLLENDELLGSVGFNRIDLINKNAELGIMIGKENYYGKGYGKEAINLILDFGFSLLNLKNISLYVFEYNEIAYNLYKKIGFKEAGRFRKMIEVFGKRYDYIAMDILDEEFESHYIKKEIEKRYKIK